MSTGHFLNARPCRRIKCPRRGFQAKKNKQSKALAYFFLT